MKDLEDELGATKLKVCHLEYDFKEVEKKSEGFSPTDTIVIRNLGVLDDGDEVRVDKECFSNRD